MSDNSNSILKTLISGSAWSFIGVLLAASFFYFQEYRNPFDLRIELIDEFNLVEIKEQISDLKIIYKNDDILKTKKEIKVVRIKISNNGDTILQNLYDQLVEFGLRFPKARILSSEIIDTNSNNLKNKLIKKIGSEFSESHDDLVFSKVIFDKGDFATIKIILIQPSNEKLLITPLGKLANIKELRVDKVKIESDEKITLPLWYLLLGYFGFIAFVMGLALVMIFIGKRKKNNKIKLYKRKHGELDETQLKIVKVYLEFGLSSERLIKAILKNDNALDLEQYIKKEANSPSLSKWFLPFSSARRLQFHTLDKDIFVVNGIKVSFNTKNEVFLNSFFSEIL